MVLNIKDSETDRLVRQLADATGETITRAVAEAVRERLDRVQGRQTTTSLIDAVGEIARRCAALPVLDDRTDEEILASPCAA